MTERLYAVRGATQVSSNDVNAILDFRFSAVPGLTWYFDHHVSAFVTPEDRAFYERRVVEGEAGGDRPSGQISFVPHRTDANLFALQLGGVVGICRHRNGRGRGR